MTLILEPTDQPYAAPAQETSAPVGTLRDDIAMAARVVAPLWPLERFVAVNPWQGLTDLGFERAIDQTRRWVGSRGVPGGAVARRAVAEGRVTPAGLAAAVKAAVPSLRDDEPIVVGRRAVDAAALVVADLLASDDPLPGPSGRTAAEARWGAAAVAAVDAEVGRWLVSLLDVHHGPARGVAAHSVWDAFRLLAPRDRRLRRVLGPDARRRLTGLAADPEAAIGAALAALGVPATERVDELRGQCGRLPGWAGYARWCDEWASADDPAPRLSLVELLAVRLSCDAALCPRAGAADAAAARHGGAEPDRARRALAAVGFGGADDATVARAHELLHGVDPVRVGIAVLDTVEAAVRHDVLRWVQPERAAHRLQSPAAQLVCCIDVRSEGLRRELEGLGPYETLGFAGFFAMPVRFAAAGAVEAVPAAPALLDPQVEVHEVAGPATAARRRAVAGAGDTFAAAAHEPAAMFALAETAGWVLGPAAACRTVAPGLAARITQRAGGAARPGAMAASGDGVVGFTFAERVAMAEGALRTMGLVDGFAPIVVLCGHGATTAANAHGASLDCGACGGNRGGANARIAATVLEDPDVRHALAERGILIPDGTWFVSAEHDTTTDDVRLLIDDVPAVHAEGLAQLRRDLDEAGRRLAARRLTSLAERRAAQPQRRTRRRAADWAQVRPEWGLAGNAAFIVAPRGATIDADLGGRAFLHSYDLDGDVDGTALATILTAPMVVGHWINLQYYGSTIDPERHGAGDKTLHNPIGGVGVLEGLGVDLRPGLPWQSVADVDGPRHEPVRLHTVVVAPVERVERVIADHAVLGELFDGAWVHLLVADPDLGWRRRLPGGRWEEVA